METKVILQISLDEEDQIKVDVNMKEIEILALVGLLEQIKLDIFRENLPMTKEVISSLPNKAYDA
jgi:glutamate formiminotransferase